MWGDGVGGVLGDGRLDAACGFLFAGFCKGQGFLGMAGGMAGLGFRCDGGCLDSQFGGGVRCTAFDAVALSIGALGVALSLMSGAGQLLGAGACLAGCAQGVGLGRVRGQRAFDREVGLLTFWQAVVREAEGRDGCLGLRIESGGRLDRVQIEGLREPVVAVFGCFPGDGKALPGELRQVGGVELVCGTVVAKVFGTLGVMLRESHLESFRGVFRVRRTEGDGAVLLC